MKQHVLIENFIYTDFDKINFLKVITIGRLDNFRPFFDIAIFTNFHAQKI